jgi:ribonucleoside-diphosphate reductase alpha chain
METDWCLASELRPGERIVVNDHRGNAEWSGPFNRNEGYLLGLLVGDGTLTGDKAILSVWQPAAVVNGDTTR